MTWTEPQYVTGGEASSDQFNAETVDNLKYLKGAFEARLIGVATKTSNQAFTGLSDVDVTSLSVTFTAEAGMLYRITTYLKVENLTAAETAFFFIRRGSTSIQSQVASGSTTSGTGPVTFFTFDEPGAGSVTYKVVVSSGTFDIAANALTGRNYLVVEDMGPA